MQRIIGFLNRYWVLLSITTVGLLLRLYNLTAISLWHDEAFSALLIKYPWREMIYRIGLDVHPPMYYFFLRFWYYIFGYSLFSLRAMSVFFGVATIIAVYVLVKKVFGNNNTALIASALVAINPFQIQYVTEARMYTMGTFFVVLSAYLLVIALQKTKNYYLPTGQIPKPTKRQLFFSYAWFTISASILTYTHYYLLFSVAALGLYGIFYLWKNFRWQFTKYIWLALSGLGIGILFLPWLKIFLFQYKQVGAGYWIPPMNIWSIPGTIYDLLIHIAAPSKLIMVLATALTLWIFWRVIKSVQQTEKWLILGMFIAPFLGSILFAILAKLQGETASVYLVRYFLFASPFLLILVALWQERIRLKGLKIFFLVALILVNLFGTWYYWSDLNVAKKPGMAALSKVINVNAQKDNKIFVASSFEFFNYKYYNKTGIRPLLYTNGSHVENLPHYAGTAILTNEDLVLNFSDDVKSGDTVWMIWTNGFGGNKPIVPSNWTQIDEYGFAEVRPYVGTWVVTTEYKVN